MAAPVLTLTDDLISKLATATGYTFTRRVSPFLKREQIVGGKWIAIAAGDEQAIRAREVDRTTLTIDIAYQEPLPDKTDAQPDPLENKTWFDAAMAKLENVKNQFRGDGDLRQASFAGGFQFATMTNTPIYRPDLMMDFQIFTAVIRFEFTGEITAT